MKVKMLLQSGLLLLLAASPVAFAKEVIHTFKAITRRYRSMFAKKNLRTPRKP